MIKLMKALSLRWMSLLFLIELFNLNLKQVEQTGVRPLPWWPCVCVSMYPPSPSALFYHLGCSLSIHQPGIDWKTFSTSLRYLKVLWSRFCLEHISYHWFLFVIMKMTRRNSSSWLNATVAADFYSHHLSLCLTVLHWLSHLERYTVPMKDRFVSRVIIAWNIWPLRWRNKSALHQTLLHQICVVLTVDIIALFLPTIVIYLNPSWRWLTSE